MRVVEVIPIVKGLARPTLSYFTKENFDTGSFVRIPLRSGSTLGIVSSSGDARRSKTALKGASFALRKLSRVERAGKLSAAFVNAVEKTADFYAVTKGSVLSALLPKILLESPELLFRPKKVNGSTPREVRLLQLLDDERYREYRSIVRENFARDTSVLFVVPSREEAYRAVEALQTGIEKYVCTTAGKSPRKLRALLAEARDSKHPIVFITTPAYIAFDRKDLGTIILDRENSRRYRTLSRPYIHMKTFLEYYAKARGSTLILGDSVLSLESLWREREGLYAELSPLTWRLKSQSSTEVVDMRARRNFEIFSPRLVQAVSSALADKQKVFIFGVRKGLSSTTVCSDCASLLLCKNCCAPVVLHLPTGQAGEPSIYVCHHCGAKRSAETRCDNCQSWKLTPLGIGIDRIAEEARKKFEGAEVFVLDKDHAPTAPKARTLVKKFEESENAIMIGSELAIQYLRGIPLVAAASLDSLFSIPDFCINERVFYLVTRLREIASERFIIQTRNAGEEVLSEAAAGNVLDFYRREVNERGELRYPPFSIFIKVSTEDTRETMERKAAHLQIEFRDYDPHFIIEKRGGADKQTLSMIIRRPRESWPERELRDKLLLLTPDFIVKVDPESIL